MTVRWRQHTWIAAAVIALAAAVTAQATRDAWYSRPSETGERLLYVRSGAALARLALEFDAITADLYWIRVIQHYGGDRVATDGRRKYELLQPLLDLTTTLDPFFSIAYRFGGIFLSEQPPGGPARPDQAIALLEKGLAAQPEKWQYLHDIGFVYYWHLHDPVAAARWFERAAAAPGAPNWLRPLAASVMGSRDRQSARSLWQKMLDSDQAWLRRIATRSLAQLQALDDRDALQARVSAAVPPGQRVTWVDLIRRGILRGVPLDPAGAAYALDAATARVSIAPGSSLNPMPDLPRALQ